MAFRLLSPPFFRVVASFLRSEAFYAAGFRKAAGGKIRKTVFFISLSIKATGFESNVNLLFSRTRRFFRSFLFVKNGGCPIMSATATKARGYVKRLTRRNASPVANVSRSDAAAHRDARVKDAGFTSDKRRGENGRRKKTASFRRLFLCSAGMFNPSPKPVYMYLK